MRKLSVKSVFYYGMIDVVGILFLIAGFIPHIESELSHQLVLVGIGLLIVGSVFTVAALCVRKKPSGKKGIQRLYDASQDERNQLIAGESSRITLDVMMVVSLIGSLAFDLLKMYIFAYISIGYIVISGALKIGIDMYLRRKF